MHQNSGPGQPGGDAEGTTLDNNANPPKKSWQSYFESSNLEPAQQAHRTNLPTESRLVDSENSQVQQDQNHHDSTDVGDKCMVPLAPRTENSLDKKAHTPHGSRDQEKTFPIPSFIDTRLDPGYEPYEVGDLHHRGYICTRQPGKTSWNSHLHLKGTLGQPAHNFFDNRNPGEARPIPSVLDMDPDPGDGPDEPHEQLYTVLTTALSHNDAKYIREQFRNSGLDVFLDSPWSGIDWGHRQRHKFMQTKSENGTTSNDYDTHTMVYCANREGINNQLRKEGGKGAGGPHTLIVQRDGGEVFVEGLMPTTGHRSMSSLVLEIFEGFEV